MQKQLITTVVFSQWWHKYVLLATLFMPAWFPLYIFLGLAKQYKFNLPLTTLILCIFKQSQSWVLDLNPIQIVNLANLAKIQMLPIYPDTMGMKIIVLCSECSVLNDSCYLILYFMILFYLTAPNVQVSEWWNLNIADLYLFQRMCIFFSLTDTTVYLNQWNNMCAWYHV